MPRIPMNRYLERHAWVRVLWLEGRPAYALLETSQQRALFGYYRPHLPLSEPQLRTHRLRVMAEQPSLPHRAGKAFRRPVTVVDVQNRLQALGVAEPAPRP